MVKYNLTRKRSMKNLRLRVKEDGNVYVSAPYGVPISAIDEFVSSRADWIEEQRRQLSENPPKTELKDGDVLTIFGEKRVISATNDAGTPYLSGNKLIVPLSDRSLETEVIYFMVGECCRLCAESVSVYTKRAGYSGVPVKIAFKLMKRRWGSYNSRTNTITFNIALCKLSQHFINYVVAHEVAHIFVPNHSKEFYTFGEQIFEGFFRTDRELNKIKISGFFQ